MSDLSRREAMKRATTVGLVASGAALLPAAEAQEKAATSDHVPITIFIHGKQEIQLTGKKPAPGGLTWGAKADDASIVHVSVEPVEVGPFPVTHWDLKLRGLKIGKTMVHVHEGQATNPPIVKYRFVLEVTVLGLQE